MVYSVKQVSDIDAAGPTLVGLWSRNLNMRGDLWNKYTWYYRSNPLGPATAFVLESQTGQIVGCCGLGSRILYVDGAPVPSGLFADFAVDKEHRTVMPALMLQRKLCGHVLDVFRLGYAFPNDAAVGIFARIGFPALGRMSRHVKVLRYGVFLDRRAPKFVASAAGTALDAVTAIGDASGARARARDYRLAWVDDCDARFDRLWEAARRRYRVIGDRSAVFLGWRFVNRLGLRYEIATLQRRESNDIAAYAVVLEREPGSVLIADFLALSDDYLGALLLHVANALRRRGIHSLVTAFLGNRGVLATLASCGFRLRHESKFVVVGSAPDLPVDKTLLAARDQWYLTEADRDN
jgi:hypothetical protein